MDKISKKKEYGSALDKALAVLELIIDQRQAIGLPDLTAKLGLPNQTVHRILLQLERHGLIIRDPDRDRFFVGPRLSRLSINALFSENQNLPTRAILQNLVRNILETCNIGILDGLEFVYLDRIESEWTLRVHLEAGSHVPAYCSSGGKILLAYLPEKTRRKVIHANSLRQFTETTICDPDRLEAELLECRANRYSTNNQEFSNGIIGVATPILDDAGRAIAALACQAPVARTSLEDLKSNIPKLQAAALELGRYWS